MPLNMATTQSSPVLVQHVLPPHTLDTIASDVTFVPLSSMPTEIQRPETAMVAPQTPDQPEEQPPMTETETVTAEQVDTPMADAPAPEPESVQESQETPPEPTSTEQPNPTIPDNQAPTEELPAETEAAQNEATPPEPEAAQTEATPPEPEAAQPEPPPPPKPDYPEWVTWEDDTSSPTEEELKEVEGTEENALDVPSIEKKVYEDWDDPDQRPAKKIRLNWVIKGVRGTKERPNMARTMHSPCALIDGHYWQIKFFPRGNKSASLSAYIRCTKHLPTPDSEVPESTFSYFEGPPDANMGAGAQPKNVLHVPATPVKDKGSPQPSMDEAGASGDSGDSSLEEPPAPATAEAASDATTATANTTTVEAADTTPVGSANPVLDEPSNLMPPEAENLIPPDPTPATEAVANEAVLTEEVKVEKVEPPPEDDFRVSAQLGMVIYNPEEPRTCSFNSSEHQFTKHNDDWGWTNFVGPWQEIHTRQRGQRQALLKNDTIAIDAYIRIFDDPSQALWWHVSHDHESIWPSKKLAGYYPMGTPPLYHSPAVAGITAWLLLAPLRKVLQEVEAGEWRRDSQVKPRPLIARLQSVLHIMRHLKREDYVNVNPVIESLKESGETFNDVKSFWEAFRRSIEIELEGETDALRQISEIFDDSTGDAKVPSLPVKGNHDVQSCLGDITLPRSFETSSPNFLPLMLEREVFDKQTCEWKLCHDRIHMNDEISLPNGEQYTLYGFMVHVGVRNSGKFYSILRPNGLGTKWLAFEDGDGNKVFSYTRKRIQDYEGLIGDELKNFKSTRQTAYMAMYIKSSCVASYLPGKLEEYRVPLWLTVSLGDPPENYEQQLREKLEEDDKDGIAVEIYSDEGIIGRKGLLDMFNIKQQALAKDHFWALKLPKDTTFKEVRQDLAARLKLDNVEKLRLFVMTYGEVGQFTSAQWEPVYLPNSVGYQAFFRRPLCLWVSFLKTEEDVLNFGIPDPMEVKIDSVVEIAAPASEEVVMSEDTSSTELEAASAVNTSEVSPNNAAQPSPELTMHDTADAPTSTETTSNIPDASTDIPAPLSTGQPAEDVSSPAQAEPAPHAEPVTSNETTQPAPEAPSSPEAIMEDAADLPTLTGTDAAQDAATDTLVPDPGAQPAEIAGLVRGQEGDDATLLTTATETLEAPTEEPLAVEHGHLVDAIMLEAPSVPPVDAATVIEETIASVRDSQAEAQEQSNDTASEPEVTTPPRPVPNVYGFLQVFDADAQNFRVHSTFFGKRDESAKAVVRRCMGYESDKEFYAWHRETTLDGAGVDDKATFYDINFSDGVDIIVGEILSDAKKEELRQQGKFSSPFALSKYLRMLERRHPVQARTTTQPIEIADFGHNYYKGPLVNGQMHGRDCLMITSYGHKYEGPLVMNDKDGALGKMTYQNGDIYEGGWRNDERDGQGTLIEKRTGNKYVGGFQNGKKWGKGVTHWQVADEEAQMCQICYGEEIDALFFDCGHVCSCVECAKQCEVCPICRKTVKQVVRMFWA